MSYGMLIRTQNGLQSIETLKSGQIVFEQVVLTKNGTASLPAGITGVNSIGIAVPLDFNAPPEVVVHPTLNQVTWTKVNEEFYTASSNMLLYVMRTK